MGAGANPEERDTRRQEARAQQAHGGAGHGLAHENAEDSDTRQDEHTEACREPASLRHAQAWSELTRGLGT